MGWLKRSRVVWVLAGVVALGGSAPGVSVQEGDDEAPGKEYTTLRDGFESPGIAWRRERADTTINLLAQERSDRAAYEGKQSERFQFEADLGSQFFVSYPLPNVPVTDKLEIVLNVRANRAGAQVFARVVLPSDVDPETKAPSFVLVPGTIFDRVDRWQRLEVTRMPPSIERQARVLRASSQRPVSLEGAYVDGVIVNLMGGAGGTEIFLDDLSVGPVSQEIAERWSRPGDVPPPEAAGEDEAVAEGAAAPLPANRISLQRNRLERIDDQGRKYSWFPTAVEAPGADPTMLRRYGFDVLVDDLRASPEELRFAAELGFSLMPRLSELDPEKGIEAQVKEVENYPLKEAVGFWLVGERLGRDRELKVRSDELALTRKLIRAIHGMSPNFSKLTVGLVEGELPLYARAPSNLDTIGVRLNHWAAAQHPDEFLQFMLQRRRLTTRANAGQLFWAWIPTTASPELLRNIWGEAPPPGWGVPRPSPEQLRLMTYVALSAGYRGLAYQGDVDLTRPAGQAQLIELAILNEEIDLMEMILANSADPIPIYPVFDPEPSVLPPPGSSPNTKVRLVGELAPKPNHKAAAIAVGRKGALLLLADYSAQAQFQPPQMATHNLVVRAILPEGAQAWEVSPGEVKLLERARVPGGTNIIVPEFGVTSMILCTTDAALAERTRDAILRARPMAVQLAIEQAQQLLGEVSEINGRLAADGWSITSEKDHAQRRALGMDKPFNDAAGLLAKAEENLQSARDARDREDFALAWAEARRASRPLRILAHAHWTKALSAFQQAAIANTFDSPASQPYPEKPRSKPPVLVQPVSCPPMIAYNTLPELYLWLDWINGKSGYRFGANRVPSGGFDDPEEMAEAGWTNVSYEMEGIDAKMGVPSRDGSKTDRVIRLTALPKNPGDADASLPPFLDFPVAAVRSPAVPVEANNLIRISVLVKRPIASVPGQGGIIVRDSIGGERLQYRSSTAIPQFSRVILYRKAPVDGEVSVTFGLAGYGEAEFDDFRVELVEDGEPPARSNDPIARDDVDGDDPIARGEVDGVVDEDDYDESSELPPPASASSNDPTEPNAPRRR